MLNALLILGGVLGGAIVFASLVALGVFFIASRRKHPAHNKQNLKILRANKFLE